MRFLAVLEMGQASLSLKWSMDSFYLARRLGRSVLNVCMNVWLLPRLLQCSAGAAAGSLFAFATVEEEN